MQWVITLALPASAAALGEALERTFALCTSIYPPAEGPDQGEWRERTGVPMLHGACAWDPFVHPAGRVAAEPALDAPPSSRMPCCGDSHVRRMRAALARAFPEHPFMVSGA
jgi:hypothetical protein